MSASGARVRFELLLGQVLAALPPPPARVVDAGGGTGHLAVALARLGYRVTVVDTSPAMLATCAQRAEGEGPEVAGRLTTVQGDAADLPGLLGAASQQVATCHELLTQVDDQAGLLAALAGVLAGGGVLSLAFANRDWLTLRAVRRGEHAAALALVEGRVGAPVAAGRGGRRPEPAERPLTLAEVEPQLQRAGLELLAAYGVGAFTEAGDDDLDAAALSALRELERRVAGREPYRSSARTVHVLARRVVRDELSGYTP